jgi:general stress protein 26
MNDYEEGMKLLEEKFGHGKDNIIALATIGREPGDTGMQRPVVRGIDALYEDGVFYISTNAKSNKMLQIAKNPEVSIASCTEMFTASGMGENLGWVLDPKNAAIRSKLRASFALWYDKANNEKDPNCCILAIRLARGTLNINHWEKLYHLDFANKSMLENGGVF